MLRIIDSNLCSFCNQQPESIEHLFIHCEFVKDLWNDLKRWMFNKLNIQIELTYQRQILGYGEFDIHFWPLNFVLTATRYCVYWCPKKIQLNFYFLQVDIRGKYSEQKHLAKINLLEEIFSKKWLIWERLFD